MQSKPMCTYLALKRKTRIKDTPSNKKMKLNDFHLIKILSNTHKELCGIYLHDQVQVH